MPEITENNRILIVDDNESIHHDFRKILTPSLPNDAKLIGIEESLFGPSEESKSSDNMVYQLSFASNGAEGFTLFTQAQKSDQPFSVVFTDVRMPPGFDGVSLIQQIWAVAPRTHVVIMTAFSDYTWEDLIERLGWSDRLIILRKPFDSITIRQLAVMLTWRWSNEAAVLSQRDELVELVRQKEHAELKMVRFHEVLDQAGDAILIIDPEKGALLDHNATLAKMLGYETQGLVGKTIDQILVKNPSGKRWQDACTLEEHFRRKDGSLMPVEVCLTVKPVGDKEYMLAIVRNVSKRKRADEERSQLESQLRQAQKMETIGTLASGIAHDFNNILSPIIVYTEMAIEEITSDRIRDDLEQVSKAAYRARDLVQHILNFSHQVERDRAPLKIHLILKEAMHLIRASLPSTIRITSEIPDCGTILTGPTHIHQILMNLCINARHAMQASGGELCIKLSRLKFSGNGGEAGPLNALLPGSYCCLEVTDTGTGMSEETRTHIFEAFYTTKPEGEGTGLGLSLVQGIVEAHKGGVVVQSRLGEGSSFKVYLPLTHEHQVGEPPTKAVPKGGSERVLFVDDEEMMARMIMELLSRYGYKVTTFTDSREALAVFRENPFDFDVLITDQTMPHMVGTDLAQRILEIRPEMPIILCTGFGEVVSEDICRELGIGGFILKPIVSRELAFAIERIVAKV